MSSWEVNRRCFFFSCKDLREFRSLIKEKLAKYQNWFHFQIKFISSSNISASHYSISLSNIHFSMETNIYFMNLSNLIWFLLLSCVVVSFFFVLSFGSPTVFPPPSSQPNYLKLPTKRESWHRNLGEDERRSETREKLKYKSKITQ